MSCSSSCHTQDHATWGECVRSKGLRITNYGATRPAGDQADQKKWDADIQAYKDATAAGIQPSGSTRDAVDRAVKISELTGNAYRADSSTLPGTGLE